MLGRSYGKALTSAYRGADFVELVRGRALEDRFPLAARRAALVPGFAATLLFGFLRITGRWRRVWT